MRKTTCKRLRQISITELDVRTVREGLEVKARGLLKGDDLLGPQVLVYLEAKSWPPEILDEVRDLLLKLESHVAQSLGTDDEPMTTEGTEPQPENAAPPESRGFGEAPLPPFEEEDLEDIADSLKIESQF